MCTTCKILGSGGDMSPRMHICEDTNQPRTVFVGIQLILNKYTNKLDISSFSINRLAYQLLQQKRIEYAANDRIYFCEDYFQHDLVEYFENLLEQNKESIPSPPSSPPGKEEAKDFRLPPVLPVAIIYSVLIIIIFVLYLIFKN